MGTLSNIFTGDIGSIEDLFDSITGKYYTKSSSTTSHPTSFGFYNTSQGAKFEQQKTGVEAQSINTDKSDRGDWDATADMGNDWTIEDGSDEITSSGKPVSDDVGNNTEENIMAKVKFKESMSAERKREHQEWLAEEFAKRGESTTELDKLRGSANYLPARGSYDKGSPEVRQPSPPRQLDLNPDVPNDGKPPHSTEPPPINEADKQRIENLQNNIVSTFSGGTFGSGGTPGATTFKENMDGLSDDAKSMLAGLGPFIDMIEQNISSDNKAYLTKDNCLKDYRLQLCPLNWKVGADGDSCIAPDGYSGVCHRELHGFSQMSIREKRIMAQQCGVEWACKGLAQNQNWYLPDNMMTEERINDLKREMELAVQCSYDQHVNLDWPQYLIDGKTLTRDQLKDFPSSGNPQDCENMCTALGDKCKVWTWYSVQMGDPIKAGRCFFTDDDKKLRNFVYNYPESKDRTMTSFATSGVKNSCFDKTDFIPDWPNIHRPREVKVGLIPVGIEGPLGQNGDVKSPVFDNFWMKQDHVSVR